MSDLIEIARQTIEKHALLKRGDGVVVGVSGGADSMALLYVLDELRPQYDLTLHVAHLDHRLRPDADADAQFVARAAERLRIPATVDAVDVRALAAAEQRSLEDAGRQARYRFYERVAGATGAGKVATAHTRDDQIETVAMRLLQGGPWEGLQGIPPVRAQGATTVVRPLLEATRADVMAYVERREIPWREDSTNRDERFLRNWIRLTFLPQLDRMHPGVGAMLLQVAELARAADQLFTQQAEAILRTQAGGDVARVSLPLDLVRSQPPEVMRRLLRLAVHAVGGTDTALARVTEGKLVQLIRGGRPGGEVDLGACVVRRGYTALEVGVPQRTVAGEYRLPVPGEIHADLFSMVVRANVFDAEQVAEIPGASPDEVYVDGGAVGEELVIRPWRHGDRFVPLGLGGTKKVHDFFVDQKIPRWLRNRVPLVTGTGGAIVWIVGHRLAESARITPSSRRIVHLRVTPAAEGRFTPGRMVVSQGGNRSW